MPLFQVVRIVSEYVYREHRKSESSKHVKSELVSWVRCEEVIRCRDCLYWIDDDFCNNPQWHVSHPACERPCTEPNGFCSWAERRQA